MSRLQRDQGQDAIASHSSQIITTDAMSPQQELRETLIEPDPKAKRRLYMKSASSAASSSEQQHV